MLLLDNRAITVDGIAVFPDHADPNQFWYLPGPVGLARRPDDDRAALTFLKYKPAAVQAGVKGGGFMMFEASLELDDDTERRIRGQVRRLAPGEPRLSAVPFDRGTVQAIALDLQGSGGTAADADLPPGAFRAVEEILGATTPSLAGDNRAAFSLTLSQEGATLLDAALRQGTSPVGVLYDLKYSALRPALNVEITADLERVYQHFKVGLEGQIYFVKASLEAVFEKLRQEGVIEIKVIDFTSAEDRDDKEKWALEFFTEHLLKEWFTPTLSASPERRGSSGPLGALGDLAGNLGNAAGGGRAGGGTGGGSGRSGNGSEEAAGAGNQGTRGGTATAARQAAVLTVTGKQPPDAPPEYKIDHQPSTSGNSETLTFQGGSQPPQVKVDGQVQTLNGRSLTLDVTAGQTRNLEVTYPSKPAVTETFRLFFDFAKPQEQGFSPTAGNPLYESYLSNNPNPADARFSGSTAPSGAAGQRGADAVHAWARDRLVQPRQVTVDAHASFEGDTSKEAYNQRLSERRRAVALGVLGNAGVPVQVTGGTAQGFNRARQANRSRDPNDRLAEITGTVQKAEPEVKLQATLKREQGQTPGQPGQPTRPGGGNGGGIPGNPQVSFKLQFVKREERKKVTLRYNRSEAVERTYAPQGFLGLLAEDLSDDEKHFVDVDLDHVFFRTFKVEVEAPFDFERIGLTSAHVALDYGDPDDADHRHGDFILEADTGRETFEVFMNADHDTSYTQQVQYHFDPDSGWEGQHFSYELPAEETEDRTLQVNPHEHLGFLDLEVAANRVDWGAVDSIDVHLAYEDPVSGWSTSRVITLEEASPSDHWKLRLSRRDARQYTYRLVHHLKDGSTRESETRTATASRLPVDDPFEGALEIEVVPLLDAARTRMAFVDVTYEDPDNDYRREERIRLTPEAVDPVSLRLALMNPDRRTFTYRLTFIGTDNQMTRPAPVTTDDPFIPVSEP